jgi:hypothetical protein
MFSPSREQARRFFFETWRKYRAQQPLEGLEKTVVETILLHPEYHTLLDDAGDHLDRDYAPESGELNPFLHLSLHLAVAEQLSIDQPRGIRSAHAQLLSRSEDGHGALHALLECLGETVWQAQRNGTAPDEAAYLECIRRRATRG